MRIMQGGILLGRIVLGAVWAMLLVVAGLAVILNPGLREMIGPAALWLGTAGIAAGTFVFMFVVADRLCPVANRGPIDAVELLVAGVMIVAFLAALVAWLSR